VARTVLVADDSPTHQRRATGILVGEGLDVVTVSNGVAAIKKLAAMKPSLILADIVMPGRDGYEVCEHVKNSPALGNVPVLLIFSDQEPVDEGRAQRARADGRIKKPFAEEDLVEVVTRHLLPEEAAPPSPPPAPRSIEPSVVTEPVDLEPDMSTRPESAELGALPEGMAFGPTSLEEPAAPSEVPPSFMEPPPPPEVGADLQSRLEAAMSPHPERAEAEEGLGAAIKEAPPSPAPVETPPEEPVLVEEAATEEPERPAERTMMFRMPVQLAQPILADDLAPAVAEPPPSAPPPEPTAGPVAATTLESFSLTDATSGQVRFAEPEAEAPAPVQAIEAEAPASAEVEPAAPVQALDVELINWIVHSVVIRMAPPALRPEALDEIVRQLTDEIMTALTQPPPEA
jgi:CheY-like chemotaxis protein